MPHVALIFQLSQFCLHCRLGSRTLTLPDQGGFAHFAFLRKPASDWGWDWGPAFAPSGIHGDVKLIALDTALLSGESL